MADGITSQVGVRAPDPYYEFWLEDDGRYDAVLVDGGHFGRGGGGEGGEQRGRPRRRLLTVAVVVCVALVAAPVAAVLSSGQSNVSGAAARRAVIAALDTTIGSGSFDAVYTSQPPTGSANNEGGESVGGNAVIDVNPFAMVVTSTGQLAGVTVRLNSTTVWEGGPQGLESGVQQGPGTPVTGFANIVEQTLGAKQGALSMLNLASPTGYLELDQNAITSANETGTGNVGGTPVTVYEVKLTPAQQANPPGASATEDAAIQAALGVLGEQGYTGMTVTISIDSAGDIVQTVSVASFSDGATQTLQVTFSNFGCAGQVLLPGQMGNTALPATCGASTAPSGGSPAATVPTPTENTGVVGTTGTGAAGTGPVTATTAAGSSTG